MSDTILNKQDVAELAQKPTIARKTLVAQKVSACYAEKNISPQALQLAEDIFRIMVHDTETKVREALSNSLKNCKDLPKDIVSAIINDRESVSVPFIQYYESLTSEDLINILNMPSLSRQKAVAQRNKLPHNITHYIAENCSDEIVGCMISNETADIEEKTFDIITSKYETNEDIKRRLIYRSELPLPVIEKIMDKLSYNLKTHLILSHNLPKDLASNLVEDIKEKMTLKISEDYSNDKQIETLVQQLYKANRLTPGLVIRAVCLGDLKFFEYSLSCLSETPITEVRKILFNSKADFMIRNLLRKALIPKNLFPAVFNALKVINEIRFDCGRSNRKAFGHKVIERILTLSPNTDEFSSDDIQYLVSKIN